MPQTLRRLIVYGVPLFVGITNFFHPVHFALTGLYQGIEHHVDWWITLHLLNLGSFALLGLAAFLLVQKASGLAATLSRIALVVYVPFYVGFDTMMGIATGVLVRFAKNLPTEHLAVMEPGIDLLWAGNTSVLLAIIGSVAWTVSMIMAAIAFTERRRFATFVLGVVAFAVTGWGSSHQVFGTLPWWSGVILVGVTALALCRPALPVAMLLWAGMLFGTTHVVPYGPLAMVCFLIAAAAIDSRPSERIGTVFLPNAGLHSG